MKRIALWSTTLVVWAMVGCGPKEIDMSEMMQAPAKPAELERLQAFVGTWEGSWTTKMMVSDEVM